MSRAPKRTPRERLVEHARFGSTERQRMLPTKYDAALRRLLRAHERELAERAVRAGIEYVTDHLCDCPGRVYWADYHSETACAAILGERGRRGRR